MANRNDRTVKVEPERLNLLHTNPGMARPQFKKVTYTELAFRAREVASAAPTRARAVLVYIDALYGPRGLRRPKEELESQGEDWGRRDYTSRRRYAMRGEPEAVDRWTLERMAMENNTRFNAIKAEDNHRRRQRSLRERTRALTSVALKKGVDPTPFLDAVEAALEEHERSVR